MNWVGLGIFTKCGSIGHRATAVATEIAAVKRCTTMVSGNQDGSDRTITWVKWVRPQPKMNRMKAQNTHRWLRSGRRRRYKSMTIGMET